MILKQYLQYLIRKYGIFSAFGCALFVAALLISVLITIPELKKLKTLKSGRAIKSVMLGKASLLNDKDASQLQESRFYIGLPRYSKLGDSIYNIFEAAAKNELNIDQVEYRLEVLNKSRFARYHVSMPLSGRYLSIRKFINLAMQNNPNLSLDHISFDRESVLDSFIEVKLDFSVYLLADQK